MFANNNEKVYIQFKKIKKVELKSADTSSIKSNFSVTHDGVVEFDSFLEDASEQISLVETQLNAVPIRTTTDTILNRFKKNIKLVFSVYSNNREEAVENYKKLFTLKSYMKPMYDQKNGQFVTTSKNLFGIVRVHFPGLPSLEEEDGARIMPTNFNFEINKDMGYIIAPRSTNSETFNKDGYIYNKFEKEDGETLGLVPIAYKVVFEGRVLLEFDETATIIEPKDIFRQAREEPEPSVSAAAEETSLYEESDFGYVREELNPLADAIAIIYFENALRREGATGRLQSLVKYAVNLTAFENAAFRTVFNAYKTNLEPKKTQTEADKNALGDLLALAKATKQAGRGK